MVRTRARGPELKPPSAAAYELRIVPRIRDVPREAWDALVGEESSPFVEWTWLDCLEAARCVGEGTGWTPLHLTLYREGKLVAAAPAYAKEHSQGEFVFDWGWAEASERAGIAYYPKLIVAVPFSPAPGDRVLVAPDEDRGDMTRVLASAVRQWIGKTGLSGAHVLFPMKEESDRWSESGFAPRHGVQYMWHRGGDRTWVDFLARFNSKRRNALKREAAHPAKVGIRIETLAPEALTPKLAREMHALYTTTVDKFFYGHRYLNVRFFELIAERFGHRLAWVFARREGRIIAGAMNLQRGKVLYGRYWGTYEEVPFLHFNVCYYHGIQHCFDHGLDTFMPGTGGEHKRVRGFDPTRTFSNHWLEDGRLRHAIEDFLAREREAVARRVAGTSDEDDEG